MKAGTVVWAKLGSHPFWPSRVAKLSECPEDVRDALKKGGDGEIVFFFGSNNYGTVPSTNILTWSEGYAKKTKDKKAMSQKSFASALKIAEKWIKDHPDSVDSDFRTENTDEQEEDKKDKKKRKRDDSPSKEDKKSSDKKAKNKDSRDEEEHDKRRKSKESMDAADRAQDEDIKWIEPSSTKSKKSSTLTQNVQLSSQEMSKIVTTFESHPISKYFKLRVVNYSPEGTVSITAQFSNARANNRYEIHSRIGSMYYLLDVASLIAYICQLHDNETAVTQDMHTTILASLPPQGCEVTVKARISQVKPEIGLVFVDSELWHLGKLIATARVIKSLLEPVAIADRDKDKKDSKVDTPSTTEKKSSSVVNEA